MKTSTIKVKILLKILLMILLSSLYLFSFHSAKAETPRLDQLVKDYSTNYQVQATTERRQTLSCNDLSGHIESLTVSMQYGATQNGGQFKARFVGGIQSPKVSSNTIVFNGNDFGIQKDVTFTFDPAIDVDTDLCANGGTVRFDIYEVSVFKPAYVFGSYQNTYSGGSASINGAAPFDQADVYFIINGVAEVNHPPILNVVADRTISEGSLLTFKLNAFDQDQFAKPTYSINNLPEHSIFIDDTFYWTPAFDQSGVYSNIELVASDAGNSGLPVESTIENISITVSDVVPNLNQVNQLVKDYRTNYVVMAGVERRQTLSCNDLSGHIESLTVSMEYTNNLNGGQFKARFVGGSSPTKVSSNTVILNTGDLFVQKDVTFTFDPAIDIDTDLCANGGTVRFDIYGLNTNKAAYVFGSYQNTYSGGSASINGAAPFDQADVYFIINEHANTNLPPTLTILPTQTTLEGSNLSFTVSATDPDNDPLTYSLVNLPAGATFNTNTGEFSWTPDYDDAGTYEVSFTVSDGVLTDTATTTIEVLNANRAPILTQIGNQTVSENQNLSFMLSAVDPDDNTLTYSALNLPTGATFNPATQTFSWTPQYTQAGNYENIEFTVSDNGSPMELDVELITITVGDVNRAPEISNPGPQEVLEADQLSFSVSAIDPDNDTVTLSASTLPTGATFNTTNGTFSWTPTLAQEGAYTVTIIATDNGTPIENATIDVVITVGDNPTPIEQTDDLIEDVILLDLPNNIENSYMANLQKVGSFITNGQIQPAINQLNAFINKVNQDYAQEKITQQIRDVLIDAAEELIGDLG